VPKYIPPALRGAMIEPPPETPAAPSYRPPALRDAAPAPLSTREEIVGAQQRKAAVDQTTGIKITAKNLPLAYRALADATMSGDEQEIGKAQRNVDQARQDLERILGGASKVENETPVIGDGSGLQQVGNAFGAFFTPLVRMPVKHLARYRQENLSGPAGKAAAGARGPARGFLEETWDQIKHPSIRQTMGDVTAEIWDEQGRETAVPDMDPAIASRVARVRDILGTPPSQFADPAFVERQRNMRADEEKARAWGRENPRQTKTLAGLERRDAQFLGEVGEMVLPTPGSLALGATAKAVGKGVGKGLGAAGKAIDRSEAGRRLRDAFTYGGPLRRVPDALAGSPGELPKWTGVIDELLETEVSTARQKHELAQRLKGLFQPLAPAERTLAIDAVEHPEILSGNPTLLEPLAQRGVDVSRVISPKGGRMVSAGRTPAVAEQIDAAARARGLPGLPAGAQGPLPPPDAVLAGLGSARPDIRKLWPARQGLRQLHEEGRAARMAVDPQAKAISEPYLVHASDQAAERAAGEKGLNVAAMSEAEREAGNRAAHGFVHKPGLRVHTERSRALNDRLGEIALEDDLADNLEPFIDVPPDTRLAMNAAMERILPPGSQVNRDFFSGRVQPQAEKLSRDIEDTGVLGLLQKWKGRGTNADPKGTGSAKIATADQMTTAPAGVGPMAVPQTPAWERVSGGEKVAVPLPVAEAVERLHTLGGKGFYDTLMDAMTGRAPAATRVLGDLYSPLSELFKIPATVMNPRYYVRNWGGNYGQTYKEFGARAFDPEIDDLAKELLRGEQGAGTGLARPVPGPGGKSTTLGEVRRKLEARGMIGDTGNPKIPIGPNIEQELADIDLANPKITALKRSLNPLKPSVNPLVQGAARKFGQGPEEAARARAMLLGYQRTGDLDSAEKLTESLLFNPNRTSEAMQRLSGPFPFVRWWGKNIPLQARLAAQQPNRVYNLTDRIPEMSRIAAYGDDPAAFEESRRRPTGKYLASKPLYWTGKKDAIGQPVVLPYPFDTEGELYDMAEVASAGARGQPMTAAAKLWESAISRSNPAVQALLEPNRDALRGTNINFELRDPSGEMIGYQESTGKAGPLAEGIHRSAEKLLGWPEGKQIPGLATSRSPASPYVMQDASAKRTMEKVPLLNAFPLSLLRILDQNSTLDPVDRVPAVFGTGFQPVPWYQTELNRAFQTKEQITHNRKTTRQKSSR
jgi:hypothetical protein